MPRIIALPGATTVERVRESLTDVSLSSEEISHIDGILAQFPVQGGRWPAFLEQFTDNTSHKRQ